MSAEELPDDVAEEELEAAMEAIEATNRDDRPDPSEVGAATTEDVLNQRSDGELITEQETVETSNGWRSVEIRQPNAMLMQWFEEQGEEIATGAWAEVYERMIIDPDLSADQWREGDLTMYADLISIVAERLGAVMQSEFVQNASEAIDERSEGDEGN